MVGFLWLIISIAANAGQCKPNEIYIRKQFIERYVKTDGSEVSSHTRQAHCRALPIDSHFQDKSTQHLVGFNTTLKPWKISEKNIIQKGLDRLPTWLRKYSFSGILRGDHGGHAKNPAATIPLTKTLLIFDQFFKSKNQESILIHETAHLAIYDFTENEIKLFAEASGWRFEGMSDRYPPTRLLKDDSSISISEDFSNHIEEYYANQEQLAIFNSMSYLVIRQLIEAKEID